MQKSIFWYDYETTGINPRADRPVQVAGIRTDEDLNIIAEPVNLYAALSDDILPSPVACLVTGITPQILAEKGLSEAQFMQKVHAELSQVGTCGAGYNSVRFDDEVTRYSLYRNFYDPYAREWQGGNSRWDLIDVLRTAYALRPEGIVWPQSEEGLVSLRLEALSAANGLEHANAHDALSDVYATIALARLVKTAQPKLYEYLYAQRSKQAIAARITLLKPMVHVSGQFGAERHYLAPVLPLAWHPTNRNALIVADLGKEIAPLIDEDAVTLKERLYTRREALQGVLPVPLKLIHLNRCPVLLPLSIVRTQDAPRLNWQPEAFMAKAQQLINAEQNWQPKLQTLYSAEFDAPSIDPEQQLYAGFIGTQDRQWCEKVRRAEPCELAKFAEVFVDKRLPELLFRFRARNYPQTLSQAEQVKWQQFCHDRLSAEHMGAPLTLSAFEQQCLALQKEISEGQQQVLEAWRQYAAELAWKYKVSN